MPGSFFYRSVLFSGFMLAFICISNCMYIPTPTHSLTSTHGVVPNEIIASIKIGNTTREELVLKIGAPDRLYAGERFFVYEWTASEGVVAVGYGYSGGAAEVVRNHYLALEFDQRNKVVRYKHFSSGLIDSLYNDGTGCLEKMLEWVEGTEK